MQKARRNFLKVSTLAGLHFILNSCRTPPTGKKPIKPTPKEVIENWPGIKKYEMIWAKERGKFGVMIPFAETRKHTGTESKILTGKERSLTHTHIVEKNERGELIAASNPSILDALSLTHHALEMLQKKQSLNLKTIHIASLNNNGKLMGYFSLHVGKNLRQNNQALNELVNELQNLELSHTYRSDQDIRLIFLNNLERYKKIGLQFRITPAQGYKYENNHFQTK